MKLVTICQKAPGEQWEVAFTNDGKLRYDKRLTWEEALGTVASIILGQDAKYLRTKEEWKAWDLKYGTREGEVPDDQRTTEPPERKLITDSKEQTDQ